MYKEIINYIYKEYDIYNKLSLRYFIDWKKEYKPLLKSLRISENQSGNTLPIVPWFSISPTRDSFRVTVLFSVKDREPFISIQAATDNKNVKQIEAIRRMGSNLLINETNFEPNILYLQSDLQKASNRPRNYEKVSVMSAPLINLSEQEIIKMITLYKIAADFLNTNNPNVLFSNDEEMNQAEEMIKTGIKFSVVASRLGHSKWKKLLLKRFNNRCAICGIKTTSLLKGSHIVGWSEAEESRGDLNNGLILCPNHDAIFDKKLISFDKDGKIAISKEIKDEIKLLNINEEFKLNANLYNGAQSNIKEYMKVHNKMFKEKNG